MFNDTMSLDGEYIAGTYKRFPLEIVSGAGSVVKGADGKEYIDLGTGIAVNAFGVADEAWKAAVTEQLNMLPHASNLYYTSPQARLARLLCEKAGMKRVFFGNSGAEANECLIKVARKWAADKYGEGARSRVITLKNSFHGRTLATLAATGQDTFHKFFGPFPEGFAYAEANNIEDLKRVMDEGPACCLLVEMVQGEGGVLPLDKEYVRAAFALCRERDMLFAVDEVQTGNGRCGALYAWQLFGVTPDLFSTAKGLAGGLPMGACLMGEKVKDVLGPGTHGSTFGGNPVCAAGAYSIISRIDEALLKGVARKHDIIVSALSGAKGIKGVRGLGLMLGIETEKPAGEVVAACMARGVLALTAKDKVRLLPALNIPDELLIKALDIIKEAAAL